MSPPPSRVVACDESGFSGGNLARGEPIFAHASVTLDPAAADALVGEVRRRLGWGGGELKASRLRHPGRRDTLRWLLGAGSGLPGHGAVHLTDTRVFVLTRLLQLLAGAEPPDGLACPTRDGRWHPLALELHRLGPVTVGPARWRRFLSAAGDLLWTTSRWVPPDAVDRFVADLDDLCGTARGGWLAERLAPLAGGRDRAVAMRAAAAADPAGVPLLAPVLPAVTCAVEHWADDVEELVVLHDEQSTLNGARIRALEARVRRCRPGLRLTIRAGVDSRLDPRVQVADWLAGTARAAASEGGCDEDVRALLAAYTLDHAAPVDR
ncbi:hypothetical protein DT076_11515 [Desertihabitans brevis]|uniref:DUF3800 domain-containing protein n=1 Tax=Desertihabitans brevis TaxID=2268447 RepID=A0A367YUC7_9ACTN|nr:hypothetical protein [Desertihabitans brevis]RCK69493.1 hypothetical protein DT076_11515 [Desertihabitans brevis]